MAVNINALDSTYIGNMTLNESSTDAFAIT